MSEEKQHTNHKWGILFTVVIMTFMTTLDTSIVNIALPVMMSQMNVTMSSVEWVASIYLIVTCATILIFGRLGDTMGKVPIFQFGVLLFTISSLLCSITHSLPFLIMMRALQGLGGAAALATNQGIITESFPAEERGKALGFVATFVALGSMAGPTIGGLILSILPWPFIFIINIPIGFVSLIVGLKTLPRRKLAYSGRMDIKGALLMTMSIVLIFIPITLLQNGVTWSLMLMLGVGVLLLTLFFIVERCTKDPLIPLRIFRNKMFIINLITMLTIFIAIGAHNILLPFYLQDVRAFGPGLAGILLTVTPVVIAVVGPLSGILSDRIGCELPTMLGLFFNATGMLLIVFLTKFTPIAILVCFLFVIALGAGLFQSPNNSLVMGSVLNSELGLAGSLAGLMRYMGMSIGVTLSTSMLYNRMSAKIGYPVTNYVQGRPDVFLYGLHWVYATLAAIVLLGATFTVVRFIYAKKNKTVST
ncbi:MULTISPECIES: MFS transporter [unclassified Clostridioides]|uniref:MFS transporter n=1 Tax=unclassified Clostridioides TaxID=2635829 RepID=UPI001D0C1FCD|nr:MFS transporter [Clostridioides sp. ES-S-0001-02]MCC0762176.1 MFS transporter [Clostridioides sp. ES-S-0006-03]UDN56796.1 MFS transporter [Clostridioides sp. ES-S-0010-02]